MEHIDFPPHTDSVFVRVPPLRYCPNWRDWGNKKRLTWRLIWHDICTVFPTSPRFLPPLCLEGDSCFLPDCPPSVTLISPFNYSRYQPPNASLSLLGTSAWKRREMEGECRGWWQARGLSVRLCGGRGLKARPLPVHQWHCQLRSWCCDEWLFLSQSIQHCPHSTQPGREAKELLQGSGLMSTLFIVC